MEITKSKKNPNIHYQFLKIMKKIIIVAAVILTASFTSCSKEQNFEQTKTVNAKTIADDTNKLDIGQADGNKLDISQADGNI